ncbi:asparagine synthase-related protein [Paludibacter sp.]|uniref:asparagine synthase-related protein n=1 Tax=Paludibacter sp. TaxID=1898105 RepID=UPI001352A16A|nr:asparagine synthase-related protein [Paludibacter sp.]MTK54528.1 hypothetical protein [Paludibacter sp.]
MSLIFGIVNLKGGAINPEDVRKLGKTVQWDDFDSKIEINSSYGWGYCWNKKRAPKAGIYTSERVAVLCDARIYNRDELKQSFEFEQPEEAFAKAYLKWGTGFADNFNGDFAAVIIDFQQQNVLLVRDHIGVRPLAYSIKNELLIFASHEFGIAKSNLINNALSEETVIRTFNLHKRQEYSLTVFKYIRKIVPGYVTDITSGKISNSKYWWPEKIQTNKNLTFEKAVSHLRKYLMKSVHVRIEQGIIGTHVSGGIDSSGVAAILADCIADKDRLKGYSWSPESTSGDVGGLNEKKLIDEFAEQKGIKVAYLSYDDPANIEDFTLPEFEQMPIEIHTMRQACEDDVSSLFSGWGGDEFVSLSLRGTFSHFFFQLKLRSLLYWVNNRGFKAIFASIKREMLPLVSLGIIESCCKFKYFRSYFICEHLFLFITQKKENLYGFGDRKGLMLRFLRNYHLPQRMDSWALFGEKFGIEYKFPLLDKYLIEYWFTIPIKYTYEALIPRFLYKEAMEGILIESIRNRANKEEAVFQQICKKRYGMIKDRIADIPNLFENSLFLPFLKGEKFYECAKSRKKGLIETYLELNDIRFFLRYKSLVEKYLVNNQIFMNSRKEE